MDTLIAENYLFEQTMDRSVPDSDRVVFKQKNLTPFIDQQRGGGEYTTGKVIVDAQSLGNGADIIVHSKAFAVVPEVDILELKAGAAVTITANTVPTNFLTVPKNNASIDSLRVEQGGTTIITESSNLAYLTNFKKHCTMSQDQIAKHGATTLYYPDSVGNWKTTAGVAGTVNVANDSSSTATFKHERFNEGLLKRQQFSLPFNYDTAFNDVANQKNELAAYQKVSTANSNVPTGLTTSYQTFSEIHRLRLIPLEDLDDYFAKHPSCRGTGYKYTFTHNQGSVEMTSSISGTDTKFLANAWTTGVAALTAGASCMPSMACLGPGTIAGSLATCSEVGSSGTTITARLTSKIDVSADALQQGIYLWVPSYIPTEEYEAKLYAQPKVYRTPFKITSCVFQNLGANMPINLQLFNAIPNPRALIVIPEFGQATQTQPSQASPFNPAPGCTDPTLSLTKNQIRVNSRTVLPATLNYGFLQFIENTSRIFSVNGGLSSVSSGIIDFHKFMNNYRYYAYDLSMLPEDQRDIPQLISFESFNNNKVVVDLYVYCLSETGATYDMIKGGVEIK